MVLLPRWLARSAGCYTLYLFSGSWASARLVILGSFRAAGDRSAMGRRERISGQSPHSEGFLTSPTSSRIQCPNDQPSRYHLGPCSRPDHGSGPAPTYHPQPCDKSPGGWYLPEPLFWLAFPLQDESTLVTARASKVFPVYQIRPQGQYPSIDSSPIPSKRECFLAQLMCARADIGRFRQEVAVGGRWVCGTLESPAGSLSRVLSTERMKWKSVPHRSTALPLSPRKDSGRD